MNILLAMLLLAGTAASQIIIPSDRYSYPDVEPLKAAVSTAFIGTPNGSWTQFKIPVKSRNIKGFRKHQRITFRHLSPEKTKDRKELVYVLAGFGGVVQDPKSNFLARKLVDQGFHAIILPSIFTAQYVIAASSEGVVGEFARDARDYFNLMTAARKTVLRSLGAGNAFFRKTHLIGYSYGALTAAFVARIDKREKVLNLEKEVLINPPTDLLGAANTLDVYLEQRRLMGDYAFTKLFLRVGLVSLWYRRYIPNKDLYLSYLRKIPMRPYEKQAMVGTGLASALPGTIKAIWATLLHDRGSLAGVEDSVLLQPGAYRFRDYLEKVALEYSRKNHLPQDTLEEINRRNGLYSLEEYFRDNSNVYLVHNRDDFLIQEGDLDFFAKAFGDRFVLYPRGGHMGNLWHPQNVKGLITLLQGNPVWME